MVIGRKVDPAIDIETTVGAFRTAEVVKIQFRAGAEIFNV